MTSLFGRRLLGGCLTLVFSASLASAQENHPLINDSLRASVSNASQASATKLPTLTPEMRGDIFMARKMYREATDMYRQAPADSPVIQNKIGIAFHQMMQFDLARKYYTRAVQLDHRYSDAINNLGTVFYTEHFYKKAIVYYKRAIRYSDPTASIYVNIGAAYFARHDYKRASIYYEDALNLDPDVFEHRGGFGTLMQERTVSELAAFHLYLAKTYAKRGNNDRALMYLRKAMEEGIHDREKIPEIPEFVQLKKDPGFQQLLADNPRPL